LFVTEELNQKCPILKAGGVFNLPSKGIQSHFNIKWIDGLFSVLKVMKSGMRIFNLSVQTSVLGNLPGEGI
jgi:hypothetical protein